jgi:hypothetical protein
MLEDEIEYVKSKLQHICHEVLASNDQLEQTLIDRIYFLSPSQFKDLVKEIDKKWNFAEMDGDKVEETIMMCALFGLSVAAMKRAEQSIDKVERFIG